MNCWSALSFLSLLASTFSSDAPIGVARFGGRFALADAVADIGHRIEAAHVLLLQEIDGVAFALGEQSDEHVGAGHLVAARRLDVQDGALDDALESAGRRRIGRAVGDQGAKLVVEIMFDGRLQLVAVDAAGGHHLTGMLVVDQRDQQMLERRIFVTTLRLPRQAHWIGSVRGRERKWPWVLLDLSNVGRVAQAIKGRRRARSPRFAVSAVRPLANSSSAALRWALALALWASTRAISAFRRSTRWSSSLERQRVEVLLAEIDNRLAGFEIVFLVHERQR